MMKLISCLSLLLMGIFMFSCSKEKVDYRNQWEGKWVLDCTKQSIKNDSVTRTDYSTQYTTILKGDLETNLYLESNTGQGNTLLPIFNFNVSESGQFSFTSDVNVATSGSTLTGGFSDVDHLSFTYTLASAYSTSTTYIISGVRQ
jgi:hypothetical protein